jgi:hypothetical protein
MEIDNTQDNKRKRHDLDEGNNNTNNNPALTALSYLREWAVLALAEKQLRPPKSNLTSDCQKFPDILTRISNMEVAGVIKTVYSLVQEFIEYIEEVNDIMNDALEDQKKAGPLIRLRSFLIHTTGAQKICSPWASLADPSTADSNVWNLVCCMSDQTVVENVKAQIATYTAIIEDVQQLQREAIRG